MDRIKSKIAWIYPDVHANSMEFQKQNVGVNMKVYAVWQEPHAIRKFSRVNTRELINCAIEGDQEKA